MGQHQTRTNSHKSSLQKSNNTLVVPAVQPSEPKITNLRFVPERIQSSEYISKQLMILQKENSNLLELIIESYSLMTKFMFGDDFLGTDQEMEWNLLNEDVLRIVLDFCNVDSLRKMSQTCKFIRNLMKCDFYYWPQVMRFSNFEQFANYLKTNSFYFYFEILSIGQSRNYSINDLPIYFINNIALFQKEGFKFINYENISSLIHKIDWFKVNVMNNNYGSGMLDTRQVTIQQGDVINLLIEALFEMRRQVKERLLNTYTELVPNYRVGIRDFRIFLQSNERINFLLKIRELEDLEKNGPIECEKHEHELDLVELSEDQNGKTVGFHCNFCNSTIGGFTCLNCNELFVISNNLQQAECPNCHCNIKRPSCCDERPMQIIPLQSNLIPLETNEPTFECMCSRMKFKCFQTLKCLNGNNGTSLSLTNERIQRFNNHCGSLTLCYACSNNCLRKILFHGERFTCSKCSYHWLSSVEREKIVFH